MSLLVIVSSAFSQVADVTSFAGAFGLGQWSP
jgi:hypothetical protein